MNGVRALDALRELRGLRRTVLTVTAPHHPDWLPLFPVAHLAEHLMGRALLDRPGLTALTGRLRRDRITVRFLAPEGAGLDPRGARELVALRGASHADFAQELRVLAVEDEILPRHLRSAGLLPPSLEHFHQAWHRAAPRVRLEHEPFARGQLARLLGEGAETSPGRGDAIAAAVHGTSGVPAVSGGPEGRDVREYEERPEEDREYGEAYAAVCRRAGGRPPELFMDAGPLERYCGPLSVLLAGLSAYRSPLVRVLRQGPRPVYTLRLFDFPWRRRTFAACVTEPAVGARRFATGIGARTAAAVAGLGPQELRTVLAEGRVRALEDLAAVLDHPPRASALPLLAGLNGFGAAPAELAAPVLACTVEDLARCRDHFVDAFTGRLNATTREAV